MKKSSFWSLFTALGLFWFLIASQLIAALRLDGGHLVYGLDDAYIHLAIAKNLVLHHVWGVTRYGFTPCSSSPLWTLLLAFTDWIAGDHVWSPLVWNLLFASLTLVVIYGILRRYGLSSLQLFGALIAIPILTPLPAMVIAGMEHTLQILLTLLLVYFAAQVISSESAERLRRDTVAVLALALLAGAVRFEGMFLILVIAALLLVRPLPREAARQRSPLALGFAALGFLPVMVHGVISVSRGWFWLPSSVMVKGQFPRFTSLGGWIGSMLYTIYDYFRMAPHLLALTILVLLLYLRTVKRGLSVWESRQVMVAVLVPVSLLHITFAGIGPLYRYEAHLVALALVISAAHLPDLLPRGQLPWAWTSQSVARVAAVSLLLALALFPLVYSRLRTLDASPRATYDIYQQQYQTASFISKYYSDSVVALNDIGAPSYFADFRCLDLAGLATREAAEKEHNRNYYTQDVEFMARRSGARIAMVYDTWFEGVGGIPGDWIKVGEWTVDRRVVLGGLSVSIYALNPQEVEPLMDHLRAFAPSLPRTVVQQGPYLQAARQP